MKLIYVISIYLIIIIVVVLAYLLTSKLLNLFFKQNKEPSLAEPIIKGLTIMGAVYAGRNELAIPLLNVGIQLINHYTDTKIELLKEAETKANTFETIFLLIIIGSIVTTYIVYAYKKKIIHNQIIENAEKEPIRIIFPKDEVLASPIFYERIKLLFELKFERENLVLSFDKLDSVLFGAYTFGLHKYFILIYCHDTLTGQFISRDGIVKKKQQLDEIIKKFGYDSGAYIVDCYYLIENGTFEINKIPGLICYNENNFLNNLIDFTTYLDKLITRFNIEKLPFSSADDDDKKYTLSQTFIQPQFQINGASINTDLEQHMDMWLQQSNRKHILILGDYGMGKSTFIKYYAAHLSKNILENKLIERFPVFISLTNTSPRHGGIDNAIGRFVSDNLGVSRKLFDILVSRGKIVFLLDGFDEMGYVGTHDQRMKQLNAIWQIATKNNKIVISGRPSYFPTEKELIDSFNVKNISQEFTPQQDPYFEQITLEGFNAEQIKQSISMYKFSNQDKEKYIDFIFSDINILDLCKRPSMMHIIREMLPKLYAEHETQQLNAGNLMRQYIDHWISRQLEKDIVSAIEDKRQKREFVWEFFGFLAKTYYLKEVEAMSSQEIATIIKSKIDKLKLIDQSDIDGFEIELLSGFFIEIEDIGYKFVHKSFKEFFISFEIIKLLQQKNFKDPLLWNVIWTKEINDFVFDGYSKSRDLFIGKERMPYLVEWYSLPKGIKKFSKLYISARMELRLPVNYKDPLGLFLRTMRMAVVSIPVAPFLYAGIFTDLAFSRKYKLTLPQLFEKGYYYCYLKDNSLINNPDVKHAVRMQAFRQNQKRTKRLTSK